MTKEEILKKYPNSNFSQTKIGQMPGGGAFSVCTWQRLDGTPCTKRQAQKCSIVIYDESGERINLIESINHSASEQ